MIDTRLEEKIYIGRLTIDNVPSSHRFPEAIFQGNYGTYRTVWWMMESVLVERRNDKGRRYVEFVRNWIWDGIVAWENRNYDKMYFRTKRSPKNLPLYHENIRIFQPLFYKHKVSMHFCIFFQKILTKNVLPFKWQRLSSIRDLFVLDKLCSQILKKIRTNYRR